MHYLNLLGTFIVEIQVQSKPLSAPNVYAAALINVYPLLITRVYTRECAWKWSHDLCSTFARQDSNLISVLNEHIFFTSKVTYSAFEVRDCQ